MNTSLDSCMFVIVTSLNCDMYYSPLLVNLIKISFVYIIILSFFFIILYDSIPRSYVNKKIELHRFVAFIISDICVSCALRALVIGQHYDVNKIFIGNADLGDSSLYSFS